jgi:hypothetical protein
LNATALKLCTVLGEPIRRVVWRKLAETAGVQDVIPTGEIVDSSNDFAGWYHAPGRRAAARRTKIHTKGHAL